MADSLSRHIKPQTQQEVGDKERHQAFSVGESERTVSLTRAVAYAVPRNAAKSFGGITVGKTVSVFVAQD